MSTIDIYELDFTSGTDYQTIKNLSYYSESATFGIEGLDYVTLITYAESSDPATIVGEIVLVENGKNTAVFCTKTSNPFREIQHLTSTFGADWIDFFTNFCEEKQLLWDAIREGADEGDLGLDTLPW